MSSAPLSHRLQSAARALMIALGERHRVLPLWAVTYLLAALERLRRSAVDLLRKLEAVRVSSIIAPCWRLDQLEPQLTAAGSGAGAVASTESLVVLIDSTARESGLGKSLTSSQPTGEHGLRIHLDKVPFDAMVAWLARLAQQHGVHVESAEIESAGETGVVNAGLVLKAG